MATVVKVMRDVFQYRSKITRDQFLTIGFAECKVILTVDVLKQCQKKHMELSGPSVKTSTSKNCFQLKSKKTPSSSTSFATVHTIAGTAGVGSVWQERVTAEGSPKPHLPLSPPASPLQSPHTSGDPTIIPEPVSVLELTPDSTPLKQSSSSSSSTCSWQRRDKEVTIMLDSISDDVEIVTIKSADNLEEGGGVWLGGCVQAEVKAGTVDATQQEQLVLVSIE